MAATNLEIWQRAQVTEVKQLATTIRLLTLKQATPSRAEPGSHIDLMLTINNQTVRRSYSVVGQSEDLYELSIAVLKTRNSRGGSEKMHTLDVDDLLDITEPIQNFPLRYGASNYLLLAGGIGITALLEMAKALKKAKANYKLLYVVKNRSLAVFESELLALHAERFQLFVDDENNPLSVESVVAEAGPETELYMCGPIRLMDAVRREWVQRKLDITNLRYETFGAGGWFEPEEFQVDVVEQNLSITVGRTQSILEALEAAGVEVMSDCKKGECGLCELRVVSCSGELEHRDVFYSETQKSEGKKIASCVSRVVSGDAQAKISVHLS